MPGKKLPGKKLLKKEQISALLLAAIFLLGGAAACSDVVENKIVKSDSSNSTSSQRAVGPNSVLPPAAAPTQTCAELDKVFALALSSSAAGKEFLATQAKKADPQFPAAVEKRSKQVMHAWIVFLEYLQTEEIANLQAAAGANSEARQVVKAVESYIRNAPPLLRGEIPQFRDKKAAYEALNAGKQPAVNPDYAQRSSQVGADVELISSCMPTWPVIF